MGGVWAGRVEAGTRAAPRAPSALGMGRGIVEGWLPEARGMEVRPGKECPHGQGQ